ncbi:DUF695 domain-containing protein [Ralstonia pickettii]|uniref:DUF695 domain-containing protein n=1 Tax=Ralstonia pickettii TaxID=329 RepID=UPI0027155AC7|nr:DUF695 domain-containing protein [Ralstonia pickettii]WKZ85964.1 DUF695 domain-containing protein [Ralstonia pickettii]
MRLLASLTLTLGCLASASQAATEKLPLQRTSGAAISTPAARDTDAWEVFPSQRGEHPALISYNKSYSQIAAKDARSSLFRVRLEFKHPTPKGWPPAEESPELNRVEDLLEAAVAANGGIQVGRITVDGHREFYFYVAFPEKRAQDIVTSVAAQASYKLQNVYRRDPAKEGYWKYLYPTADDQQVIGDMRVLDSLRQQGDIGTVSRHVTHWAYFPKQREAQQFANWANANAYKVSSVAPTADKSKVGVRFTHDGTMELEDITHHTISINRKARALGGDYDGWETSVERKR